MVSQHAKTNMQLASYTVRHHNRISRAVNVQAMNPTSIRRLCELKLKEDSRDSDAPSAPTIDPKNWPKTINALQETKAPLACAIRDVATAPPEAGDLATNCNAPENKMIAGMPHLQEQQVLDLCQTLTRIQRWLWRFLPSSPCPSFGSPAC
jgi:hypothetical protein